jgi:hypothetical protein
MASIRISAMRFWRNAVRFCLGGLIAGAVQSELRCKLRHEHVSMNSPYRECWIRACFVENDSKPTLIIGRAMENSSRPVRTSFIRRATSNGGRPCARSCSKEIPCSFSASGSHTGCISQCKEGLTRWLSDWISPVDVSI